MTWLSRTLDRHKTSGRHRRELAHLAALPDYLLRDIGLTREPGAGLTRQIRNARRPGDK